MAGNLPAFILISAVFFFSSCVPKKNPAGPADNRIAMMKADVDFSNLSRAKGMKFAFLEYIDSNGVLLRPDTIPVIGADAVDYLLAQNDTGFSLTWKPTGAAVAASGDLGYTYGIYELHPKTKDTLLYGTYVSIWKKQADGKWKFVMDSGNEGIGQ
jgi:ketosteroid isomerase-like protein